MTTTSDNQTTTLTDPQLLTVVEVALAGMTAFDRAIFSHARRRITHGVPLTPAQREQLHRVIRLRRQLGAAMKNEEEVV